jgi:ribonuclease T2
MSYQEDFCVATPTSASCTPDAATGMTLHGLWPDRHTDYKDTYQFCGYNEAAINQERWCSADIDVKDQFAPGELAALSSVMPGVQTCLYNHEWYSHGTCSGLSVAAFFEDALTLAGRFRALPAIQKLIQQNSGKTLDRASIQQAAASDLGPKAADAVLVMCRLDSGKAYFSEIEVALDRKLLMDFPAPDSLAQIKPYPDKNGVPQKDQGNCPETGIIVTPW